MKGLAARQLFGQVDDRRVGCVFLYRLDAVLRAGLGLVTLTGGDDFTVGCLEVEALLTPFVFDDLELARHGGLPSCAARVPAYMNASQGQ